MHYHFRLVAGSGKELVMAGHLPSLEVAMRAVRAAVEWKKTMQPGQIPADVENLMAIADAGTLKIALTSIDSSKSESVAMVFERDGTPIVSNAEQVWPLVKRGLQEIM